MSSETFKEEIEKIYPNNLFLLYRWKEGLWYKGKRIWRSSNNFIIQEIGLFFIMLYFCLKYKPKIVYIEHTYLVASIGFLRKLGIIKKLIHFPGDWLTDKFYPYFDRIACYWADVVWDTARTITNCRFKRWNKDIPKKVVHYHMRIRKKFTTNYLNADKVLFHGQIRMDSGLEIIQRNKLFKVKIPGYINRKDFKEVFDDCFCGINLLTDKSFSANAIPSKILEYLQFGLPPIVSSHCGYICYLIKKYQLGIVLDDLNIELVENALLQIYKNKTFYRRNIERYLDMVSKPTLREIFKTI